MNINKYTSNRPPLNYSPKNLTDKQLIKLKRNKRNIQITTDDSTKVPLTISTGKSKNEKINLSLDPNNYSEKFNVNQEASIDDLTEEGKEIASLLKPKFENLKIKENVLDNLTRKAKEYIKDYQINNETLHSMIEKHKKKKIKIQNFIVELNQLRRDLKERECLINEKENEFTENYTLLEQENNKLNLNKEKFKIYIDKKSQDILLQADDLKRKMIDFSEMQIILQNKENEYKENIKKLNLFENELKLKSNKYESDIYDFNIYKKEFELHKEEFDMQSGDIIKKYTEMKIIQEEINQNKNMLINIDKEIESKHQILNSIDGKHKTINYELIKREEELNKRDIYLQNKENEINLVKKDLDEKLEEVSYKLEDTKKMSKQLIEKENILKIKQNINSDLDLKLTEIEFNEATNRKKYAIQQKLLNEELTKKVNSSYFLNNTNNNYSKIYK